MAFELEISRKSKVRIGNKLRHYSNSTLYDYIFYFFSTEELMKKFKEILEELSPQSYVDKFLLFYIPTLFSKDIQLDYAEGYFQNKKIRLGRMI